MDKQREIFQFFTNAYNERFQANVDRNVLNAEGVKVGLSPDGKKALETMIAVQKVVAAAQTEAVAGAVSETLAHFIKDN